MCIFFSISIKSIFFSYNSINIIRKIFYPFRKSELDFLNGYLITQIIKRRRIHLYLFAFSLVSRSRKTNDVSSHAQRQLKTHQSAMRRARGSNFYRQNAVSEIGELERERWTTTRRLDTKYISNRERERERRGGPREAD